MNFADRLLDHWILLVVTYCLCGALQIITQFKEQGLNTELYYKNKEMGETFNIVPTSAIRYEFAI